MTTDSQRLDRLSSTVCFVIPIRDGHPLDPEPDATASDVDSSWIDDDTAVVVNDARSDGGQLRPVEVGRGAASIAFALTLAGYVADVGGAVVTVLALAKGTRKVWRSLRGTRRGIISVSSGAAGMLALARASELHEP